MVLIEIILYLGSVYTFIVQAQIPTDVDCEKYPLNPLCSFSQTGKVLNHQTPAPPFEIRRTFDLMPDFFNLMRKQRYPQFIQPNNPRPPNLRPPNALVARPGHFYNQRRPVIQNVPDNIRMAVRPDDLKTTPSNRKKRFFFWYTPSEFFQAKRNLFRNNIQRLQQAYQGPQPVMNDMNNNNNNNNRDSSNNNNHNYNSNNQQNYNNNNVNQNSNNRFLPLDDYDCVQGKLKPVSSNALAQYTKTKNGVLNLNAHPIILASPIVLKEPITPIRSKASMKTRKKVKPVNYEVHMEEEQEGDSFDEDSEEIKLSYMRDHAPESIEDSNDDSGDSSSENMDMIIKKKSKPEFNLSTKGERIEFQVQGHNGPRTYIFGFDTGEGKNRQYRLEERLKDGTVKGQYGYYDARGKLRTIKYIARPVDGYKEQHHEMTLSDLS